MRWHLSGNGYAIFEIRKLLGVLFHLRAETELRLFFGSANAEEHEIFRLSEHDPYAMDSAVVG